MLHLLEESLLGGTVALEPIGDDRPGRSTLGLEQFAKEPDRRKFERISDTISGLPRK